MITRQPPRPLCTRCKFSLAKSNGRSKFGFKQWQKYCVDCSKAVYSDKHKHFQNKTVVCGACKFKPEDQVQMDLCYRDGNKKNKSETNLITLCANCARIHNKKIKAKKKSILNATVDSETRIT